MVEEFAVEEGHVAGFGNMTTEVHSQLLQCLVYSHEARPGGGYTGLMEILSAPMTTYCDGISDRVGPLSGLVGSMRDELVAAAWDYHGTDRSVYEEFHHVPYGPPGHGYTTVKDFPHPAAYSAGTAPGLEAPPHEEADIKALVDEVGGSIKAIDWVFRQVAGWSPVDKIVEPISGNWAELDRAGTVLERLGDGFERSAGNLTAHLGSLSQHWYGGAANSFETYATRLGAAIEVEGPINRLVGYVLKEVAGEFERVAEFIVSTLKSVVDKIATTVATGWVPFVGWAKVAKTIKDAIDIFNQAKDMIESLEETIEKVQTIIEAVQDPVEFVRSKAEEVLEPYIEGAEVAADLAALDPDAITEAPEEEYTVGTDPRRTG